MDYEQLLEEKILERLVLIQSCIKHNVFNFDGDGSFKLQLELLDQEIGQLKDKIDDSI